MDFNPPKVKDPSLVGTYPGFVNSGGGYVWDDVLEYRVWCHEPVDPEDDDEGDFYYAFETYDEALDFSKKTKGADKPLALVFQKEYISEPTPNEYVHIKNERMTEWPVEFLKRPRRTSQTIPAFLDPNAPENRLDILRGLA